MRIRGPTAISTFGIVLIGSCGRLLTTRRNDARAARSGRQPPPRASGPTKPIQSGRQRPAKILGKDQLELVRNRTLTD